MESLLRTGIAVFPDYKATMLSEWWAVTLLRHDTLLLARQSWLSCKAATLIPQAGWEPLQKENMLTSWLGEWERRPQPKGGGRQREAGKEGERSKWRADPQGAAGKEARARNLGPGKSCTPTFAPTRPRLILAQQKRQAHWSSTVEWGWRGSWTSGSPQYLPCSWLAWPLWAHTIFFLRKVHIAGMREGFQFWGAVFCAYRAGWSAQPSGDLPGSLESYEKKEDLYMLGEKYLTRGELLILSGAAPQTSLRAKGYKDWGHNSSSYAEPCFHRRWRRTCTSFPWRFVIRPLRLMWDRQPINEQTGSAPRRCQILLLILTAKPFILKCFCRQMNHGILSSAEHLKSDVPTNILSSLLSWLSVKHQVLPWHISTSPY